MFKNMVGFQGCSFTWGQNLHHYEWIKKKDVIFPKNFFSWPVDGETRPRIFDWSFHEAFRDAKSQDTWLKLRASSVLSRKLDDRYWEIIDRINSKKHIISIDVPSGISDSPLGGFSKFIISKYTVTFGYSKLAHYMNPINNIVVSDIGFKNLNKINMCKII